MSNDTLTIAREDFLSAEELEQLLAMVKSRMKTSDADLDRLVEIFKASNPKHQLGAQMKKIAQGAYAETRSRYGDDSPQALEMEAGLKEIYEAEKGAEDSLRAQMLEHMKTMNANSVSLLTKLTVLKNVYLEAGVIAGV